MIDNIIEVGKFKTTRGKFFSTIPYSIAFVTTQDNKKYIVKGMSEEVEDYIKSNFPINSLINYSFWKDGKSRSYWKFNGIVASWSKKNDNKYYFCYADENGIFHDDVLAVRRIPRNWIPIYGKSISYEKLQEINENRRTILWGKKINIKVQ